MWHLSGFLLASVAAGAAALSDGSIHIFDSAYRERQSYETIPEHLAKLLLQKRMLSTQLIAKAALVEPAVELLNSYGGDQTSLFDNTPPSSEERLLIIVDGLVYDAAAIKPRTPSVSFKVPELSPDFMDNTMVESLLAPHREMIPGLTHCIYDAEADTVLLAGNHELQRCLSHLNIPKDSLNEFRRKLHGDKLAERSPLQLLETWSSTDGSRAILRVTFKGYVVDPLVAVDFIDSLSRLFATQGEQTVLLLSQSHLRTQSSFQNQSLGKRSTLLEHSKKSSVEAVPSTLMPVCYASNKSCIANTNDCSGHGACFLKSSSKDDKCYACKCGQTTVKTADGSVRTVNWGGPACQKEDISVPFFLLGTITVLAILAVGGGAGMLFSVGQEELPSVISAGVSSIKSTG